MVVGDNRTTSWRSDILRQHLRVSEERRNHARHHSTGESPRVAELDPGDPQMATMECLFEKQFKFQRYSGNNSSIKPKRPVDKKKADVSRRGRARESTLIRASSMKQRVTSDDFIPRTKPARGLDGHLIRVFERLAKIWKVKKKRDKARRDKARAENTNTRQMSDQVYDILQKYDTQRVPGLQFFVPERDSGNQNSGCYEVDKRGRRRRRVVNSSEISRYHASSATDNSETKKQDRFFSRLANKADRRIELKRDEVHKVTSGFRQSQNKMKNELATNLALLRSERKRMQADRSSAVAVVTDSSLPSYQLHKDLHLAHLKTETSQLHKRCETLQLFAVLLKRAEYFEECTGVTSSDAELRLLSLFSVLVKRGIVFCPLVSKAIISKLSQNDKKCIRAQSLIQVMEVAADQPAEAPFDLNLFDMAHLSHSSTNAHRRGRR